MDVLFIAEVAEAAERKVKKGLPLRHKGTKGIATEKGEDTEGLPTDKDRGSTAMNLR